MPDYTTTAKSSEVIERIAYLLEEATPEIAPSVTLTRHTDTTCLLQDVTDPGRFRLFTVRATSAQYGTMSWSRTTASFDFGIKISVGYPAADYYPEADDEEVDGYRYLTEDLKVSDFEQIVKLVEGSAPWDQQDADHPAITQVQVGLLRGAFDEAGGRVRSIIYGVQLARTYS
jgi:hypothetical protein